VAVEHPQPEVSEGSPELEADPEVRALYAPEGRSVFYQWQRRKKTQLGNAVLLSMARHLQRLPEARGHRLGARVGALMRRVSPRHYHIVLANMRLALGEGRSEAELAALARACYTHLGKCLMEFIRLPAMSHEEVRRVVALEGSEHLEAALAGGKGAILLTGHLGNWEMIGARLAAGGYPVVAIARAQRDTALTDFILRTRESTGMKIYHRESAVKASLLALKSNEFVGMLMDQNAGDDGVFVDFFGHLASTAGGAAVFALRTGTPVLPCFGWRNPDDTHTARIDAPVPLVRTGDRKQDILENTARYTKVVEAKIRAHPGQWFWLHKRWKSRPPQERGQGA
jgi:Kdo2-lipid IVA lauroyltransferase/acyltransferase